MTVLSLGLMGQMAVVGLQMAVVGIQDHIKNVENCYVKCWSDIKKLTPTKVPYLEKKSQILTRYKIAEL